MDCVFIKEIIKLLLNPMKEALQDEEIFKKFQDLSYNYWTKLQSTSLQMLVVKGST